MSEIDTNNGGQNIKELNEEDKKEEDQKAEEE